MNYELYIHTKYSSDGIIEPERIVKIAIKRGLNGIARKNKATYGN